MDTPSHISGMRIVGGDLALDFVNTRTGPPSGPPSDEALRAYEDLVLWARYVGELGDAEVARLLDLGRSRPDEAAVVHERARSVRDALFDIFSAIARRQASPASALAVLRDGESDSIEHASLVEGDDGLRWTWESESDLARPLWPAIHAATELATSARTGRIKMCGGCRFLFVDTSKSGSRRWCAMEDCGALAKGRAFVERRREARRAASGRRPG